MSTAVDAINAVDQVGRFVATVFEPEDLVEVRLLPSRRQEWVRADRFGSLVGDLKERNASGQDVYVGANPRKRAGTPGVDAEHCTSERPCGGCDDCAAVARSLFVDFDPSAPNATVTAEEARRRIEEAVLPFPTVVISSGRGVHAYWKLETPMTDLEVEWRGRQRAVIEKLHTDPSIHNPSRIMRSPGFVNLMRGKNRPPAPVELVEVDERRVYSIEEFPAAAVPTRIAPSVGNGELVEGFRRPTLMSLAGTMHRRGMSTSAIEAALLCENEGRCRPPLPVGEVTKLAKAVKRYPVVDGGAAAWPTVRVDTHLRNVTAGLVAAIVDANDPPVLFQRVDHLARIRRVGGQPVVEAVGLDQLRERLSQVVNTAKGSSKGDKLVPVYPPEAAVRTMLAAAEWSYPYLVGVVDAPVLRPDGSVLDRPGYDAATGLVFEPSPDLNYPGLMEFSEARELLVEVIKNFPFVDDDSRANAAAMILTPHVRPAINGHVPLGLIDKPQPRTGATLLVQLAGVIATGEITPPMTCPSNEEEWQKVITAQLVDGPRIVLIDNVVWPLRSQHLAAVLTADTWTGRVLGLSKMAKVPARSVWVATGNNLHVAGEIARRGYWVRMDAKTARPEARTGFVHPELLEWASKTRGRLVSACLTLAADWYAKGKPAPEILLCAMGGFNEWVHVLGGILAHAGIGGFLGNADELLDRVDDETAGWVAFLSVWRDDPVLGARNLNGETVTVTTTQVEQRLRAVDGENMHLAPELRQAITELPVDGLADALASNTKSFSIRLGKALGTIDGKRFDDSGLRVEKSRDTHNKSLTWKVVVDAKP